MYYLFRQDVENLNPIISEDVSYEVRRIQPGIFRSSLPYEKISFRNKLLRAYFRIITMGKFWIYFVVSDENEIIHTSYVLGKCYKFPFMSKYDYEIGPCMTSKEYRGRGIYPKVIKNIVLDNRSCERSFYMICHENNLSSIRGITKAGFEQDGFKEKIFKGIREKVEA